MQTSVCLVEHGERIPTALCLDSFLRNLDNVLCT